MCACVYECVCVCVQARGCVHACASLDHFQILTNNYIPFYCTRLLSCACLNTKHLVITENDFLGNQRIVLKRLSHSYHVLSNFILDLLVSVNNTVNVFL